MQIVTYLTFPGTCKEALEFYAKALGGTIIAILTYGETPAADYAGPDGKNTIIHGRMVAGAAVLMASDAGPGRYEKPTGISASLHFDTIEEAESVYFILSEGADISMPMEETFWALRFAALTDKYGTPWLLNVEKPF